jgi:hypothetical protein
MLILSEDTNDCVLNRFENYSEDNSSHVAYI